MQGIWSASVDQPAPVMKSLYSDAGSGIIFNLTGEVTIDNKTLPKGVIALPVKRHAENITLTAGAQLAGIRFYPAMGYGVLGQHYDKPTLLLPEQDQCDSLYQTYSTLQAQKDHSKKIDTLYIWAKNHLALTNVIPNTLEKAMESIEQGKTLKQVNEDVELSQRQIERLFKRWLGITPKHYQRILRAKKVTLFLRRHKNGNLADIAQKFGFSDQAHMTRELRTIACITPRQI